MADWEFKTRKKIELIPMIISIICKYFDITEEILKGNNRKHDRVIARHIAMFLIFKWTGESKAEIGRLFNRDHTSIIHACEKMANVLFTHQDPYDELMDLDNYIENIIKKYKLT